jgi:hypothetical protein
MMNNILDNESYPVEERLEMAKVLLEMKDREIQRLTSRLNQEKSTREWIQDQASDKRMGL